MESYQPDIICITETWLCTDVLDNEISIPGYNTYRQDRNRHRGGILMYTRCELAVSVIPNMSPSLDEGFLILSFVSVFFIAHRVLIHLFLILFLSLWKNLIFLSFVTFYVSVILMINHIVFILSFAVF